MEKYESSVEYLISTRIRPRAQEVYAVFCFPIKNNWNNCVKLQQKNQLSIKEIYESSKRRKADEKVEATTLQ